MTRLLLLAALLAGPAMAAPAKHFTCERPGVIDGDTFRCADGLRVRVWRIDAPERYTPAGPASTAALANLITGKRLSCVRKGRSRERVVALCRAGNRDVAAEMIRQGHAVEWVEFSKGFYSHLPSGRKGYVP